MDGQKVENSIEFNLFKKFNKECVRKKIKVKIDSVNVDKKTVMRDRRQRRDNLLELLKKEDIFNDNKL